MDKLQSQSGAEFDKNFVRMAFKGHKKSISEFEKARTDIDDPEIKSFIDESLPKLRNHLQMAKSAARTVGVDESTLAADRDDDSDTAVGSPATGVSGTRGSDKPSSPASNPDKNRSSIERFDGATDTDASGTIHHNNPSAVVDANVGDRSVSASAEIDRDSKSVVTEVDASKERKLFKKGDGRVLGLSTDKNDGKLLGIIPSGKKKYQNPDASVTTEVDVNGNEASVGASATTESESATSADKK
jgi:hypothetical protein